MEKQQAPGASAQTHGLLKGSEGAMAHPYAPVEAALGADESFLSLADILMSQERLPCRAEVAWPRLAAFLARADAAAAPGKALPEGSKLEIPLWLAKGLYDKRRILSVELPKVYKESWRTVFNADASVIDLHKLGPYYYGFGSQLLNFDNPENTELAQSILQDPIWVGHQDQTPGSVFQAFGLMIGPLLRELLSSNTFIGRFRHIMDSSQNTFNEDTSVLVARLDELERALFQTGQKELQDFQCWEMGQASQITVSSLIQNYKKRKFTDVDS